MLQSVLLHRLQRQLQRPAAAVVEVVAAERQPVYPARMRTSRLRSAALLQTLRWMHWQRLLRPSRWHRGGRSLAMLHC